MSDEGQSEPSRPYRPPLSGPRDPILLARTFTAATVTGLRHLLAVRVAAAGLAGEPADDFVLAVHELVTNAVRHGGGTGHLQLVRRGDVIHCTVTDHGTGQDGLPVDLPETNVPGGRGLWLAHHLTGTLVLQRQPGGLAATVTVHLSGPVGPAPRSPRG
ncbi:ATP-binding protein [Micromonospora sp. NPDC049497]|uniref:ATP-binding protein n=1 Tax=Micromonospora sp. NPDC049497 TaxID=3364273 RepID=UPI0037B3DD76